MVPGIIERQDLAIAVALQAALLRADLAQSDAVACAVALKQNPVAAVDEFVKVAADGVPSQRAAHRQLEIGGADALVARGRSSATRPDGVRLRIADVAAQVLLAQFAVPFGAAGGDAECVALLLQIEVASPASVVPPQWRE